MFVLHRLQIKTVLRYESHESGMGHCEKLGLRRCRLEVFDSIPKEGVLNKLSRGEVDLKRRRILCQRLCKS